jgi:hypothetical protein
MNLSIKFKLGGQGGIKKLDRRMKGYILKSPFIFDISRCPGRYSRSIRDVQAKAY